MLPNFFVQFNAGLEWDLVFTAIHPFVIIVVTARSIGIRANTLERQAKTTTKDQNDPNASVGTELSDYSISLS